MSSYTTVKYITISGTTLTEYTDLTTPIGNLIGTHSYLVVINNFNALSFLSIDSIMRYLQLDITQPIGTVLTSYLNNLFVEKYNVDGIPSKMASEYYQNRLRVLNPVSYKDYTTDFTSINTPTIINDPTKRGSLDDLVINASADLSNSLVAVNGVFHKTLLSNNSLYVLDGFRNIRISGRKDVTLVDTSHIGGHTVLPLTPNNVVQTTYNDWAYIMTPSSIYGKTLFLVVDGYFYHLSDNVLTIFDSTHVGIKTNLLPLVQQFRHNPRTMYTQDKYGDTPSQGSSKYTDNYDTLFINNRSLPANTFTSLDFQYSRITHYHSFLVIVNNPKIYTVEREVAPTGTPRFYYDYSTLPLSGMASYGCGLCPSYLIHREGDHTRKQVFISGQDNDIDLELNSINPIFIPALIDDAIKAANISTRFIDYVSA